jgi:hypothetical protein
VNLRADEKWWLNTVTSRRLLLDLVSSTGAQGVAVDVVHPADWAALTDGGDTEQFADDVLEDSSVAAALDALKRLVPTMPGPVLGVLPDIRPLETAMDSDLLSDALCDLSRGAMAAGLAGIVVLGQQADSSVVARVVRIADNFGCPVLSLGPAIGAVDEVGNAASWALTRADADGVAAVDGAAVAGVVLTPGDVSAVWSRAEIAAFGSIQA